MEKDNKSDSAHLRQKAEELLKKKSSKTASPFSEVESIRLIHELEVHQIELELQNEELRRAWADAEVANDKYIRLYDFAPSGYFTLSGKGGIIELNLSGARMLGKDRQHLKSSLFGFFVSEETKPIFSLFLEKAFKSKAKESCEVMMDSTGSLPFHVLLTGVVSDNEEHCLVTAVDITERKQAEKTVKESEEKFRKVFSCSRDALILIDKETGNILDANDYTFRLYGYSRDEILNLKNTDLSFEPEMTALALKEFIERIEVRYHKKKDGTVFPVDISASLFMLNGREVVLASIRDITDRLKAEELLNLANKRFKTIFDKNTAAMLLIDPETGAIIDANAAAAVFYGYSIPALCTMNIDRINTMPAFSLKMEMEKAVNRNENLFIFQHLLASGEVRSVEVHSSPIDYQGKRTLFSIMFDVTQRVQAEEEIKLKNDELRHINAEKDKFFSIIAHDLRGPFNGFLGLTQIMSEKSSNLSLNELQVISRSMNKSATNLFDLLNNLLEWARMQQHATNFEPKSLLLLPFATTILQPLLDSANKKGIELIIHIPENLQVFADENMLSSTIHNLSSNAVKFTPAGGKVNISAKATADGTIEISVKDSGIGMNAEILANMFTLSKSIGRKGTDGEPSTGLGLLLCKDFIEKNGGKIWAESKEGKGSTFYFTLSGSSHEEKEEVRHHTIPDSKITNQVSNLKILIAEDDHASEKLISIMSLQFSSNILKAHTGIEAVEFCRNNPDIDLVLMDINMPVMDGLEATRQIRLFNAEVIIIAQTANDYPEAREKAMKAGCNYYITKPINKEELLSLIKKYFG